MPVSAHQDRIRKRRKREENRRLGRCELCGDPDRALEEGTFRCLVCILKARVARKKHSQKQRAAWRKLGLCPSCNGQRLVMTGRSQCAVCAEARDEYYQRRKESAARAKLVARLVASLQGLMDGLQREEEAPRDAA